MKMHHGLGVNVGRQYLFAIEDEVLKIFAGHPVFPIVGLWWDAWKATNSWTVGITMSYGYDIVRELNYLKFSVPPRSVGVKKQILEALWLCIQQISLSYLQTGHDAYVPVPNRAAFVVQH